MQVAAVMAAAPQPSSWSLPGKAFLRVSASPVSASRQVSGSMLCAFAVCWLRSPLGVALPWRCISRT